MNYMTEIDKMVHFHMNVDTFVEMTEDGKLLAHQEGVEDPIGTWVREGEGIKVTLKDGTTRTFNKEEVIMATEQEPTEKRLHYPEGTMQCKGTTKKNGKQCTRTSKKGEEYCHQHMPKEGSGRKGLVLTTPFEAGAVDYPEETKAGVTKAREALNNQKEEIEITHDLSAREKAQDWFHENYDNLSDRYKAMAHGHQLDDHIRDHFKGICHGDTGGECVVCNPLDTNKKEKQRMLMPIDSEKARELHGKVDFRPIDQKVLELYGYRPGQIYSTNMVIRNSGQAHDNSKPGYLFYASDYVGQIMRDKDNNLFVVYDRKSLDEPVITELVPVKEEEEHQAPPATNMEEVPVATITNQEEEDPMLTNLVIYRIDKHWVPEFGPKAEHGVYYWKKRTEVQEIQKSELKATSKRLIEGGFAECVIVAFENGRFAKITTEDSVLMAGGTVELHKQMQNRSN